MQNKIRDKKKHQNNTLTINNLKTMNISDTVRIAIFGSGNGTNAQCICEYFAGRDDVEVGCIIYNKKDAYIAQRANNLGIESHYFGRTDFYDSQNVVAYLKEKRIDWVILAGFLWLVPENLLQAYPNKIINIHPALLPKYGGKGMYGDNVHAAVIANNEPESGITIHIVDNRYDCGITLFQTRCIVDKNDTVDSLATKIHKLEHEYFPKVIESTILGKEIPR